MIPRANHNTHRTTFVIISRTGCCRAAKSTRITTDLNEHVCAVDNHAIYGRDTTDQNEHVFAIYIIQFTVVIPRTRTNMFVQYIACNHKIDVQGDNNSQGSFFSFYSPSLRVRDGYRHHHKKYENYHENSTSVLGPDVAAKNVGERVVISRTRICSLQSCKTPKIRSSRVVCWSTTPPPQKHPTKPPSCKAAKSTSSRTECWHRTFIVVKGRDITDLKNMFVIFAFVTAEM